MVQTLATEDKTKTIKNTCCQVPHGITGISFESRLLFGRSCRTTSASFATGPGSGEKHLDLLLHLSWGLPAQGQTFLSLLCQLPLDLGQLRLT